MTESDDHRLNAEPLVLTRSVLREGGLHRMLARSAPDLRLLSDAEREQSLRDTLAARPEPGHGAWLFAYGSLIWNPAVEFVERRTARIRGWHRAFCLSVKVGRGTPDNPGLLLGLDQGGRCDGVAYRIAEAHLAEELDLIWRREMLSGAYVPRWLALEGPDSTIFGHAIAFTINPASISYAGDLTEEETVRRLATGRGDLGSAADYLFRTREGLRHLGVHDELVERLAEAVARGTTRP